MNFDMNEKLDFSYPEGFQKAAASLEFLPEEQRVPMLATFLTLLMQL
ncbi:MAG: hypothetical protein IJT62_07355 [Oscillospiraceae bacterium]|nr:hypothetical protein [Oscillospiraceae bacterium]